MQEELECYPVDAAEYVETSDISTEDNETAYDQNEVRNAFNVIKSAMIADTPESPGSYAHAWHCNIAMSFYDAIEDHKVLEDIGIDIHKLCNEGASRFMKLLFDVETKA